jgi:hypothetical protein
VENLILAPDSSPSLSAAIDFIRCVERLYTGLISAVSAGHGDDSESGLGGQLLYAGQLDEEARALLVAGNVSGAASLAATADPAAQKQAIRDGVADFLVTSLDEALRILKNEIRKRQSVAVCVAAPPEAVEREMLERGVLPDLLRPAAASAAEYAAFLRQGARRVDLAAVDETQSLVTWSVAAAPAEWLPKLDAVALDCLGPEDWAACRWLRLAPGYLGRLAQGLRLLRCNQESAQRFVERVRDRVGHGEIGVAVEVRLIHSADGTDHQFSPPTA